MGNIIETIIVAFTSSGFMSVILYLIQRHDKKKEREEMNETGQSRVLRGLAHDRILFLTDNYIKRGAITAKEKSNLKYLYQPYHDIGGNGDCETGYEACDKLPIVSEEVKDSMEEKTIR